MRDPNRIPEVLQLLQQGWEQSPDLRLGQIFENLKRYANIPDLFYIEDSELARIISDYFDLEAIQKNSQNLYVQ